MIKTTTPLSNSPSEVIIPSDPVTSLIQCRNNITQNINNDDWTNIAITGIEDLNIGSDFEIFEDGIKCLFDGQIDIYASIRGESTAFRASPEIRITKNNVAFDPISSSGYIRAAGGHNISSSSIRILSDCNQGDIIRVQSHKEANVGVVTMLIGTSVFLIKRIN